MTEYDWLTCGDPSVMLRFLHKKNVSLRKIRLFICACYQSIPKIDDSGRVLGIRLAVRKRVVFVNRLVCINQRMSFKRYHDKSNQ